MKPISPSDVVLAKTRSLPGEVIEAFNELIAENWNGRYSYIKQDDVMKRVLEKFKGSKTRQEIFNKCWLDVEDSYRAEGWQVVYDKPGYNESYDANFTFSKK